MTTPRRSPGLVSVIIPAHNSERFVWECLTSVLGQTYADVEAVVVDDASEDATVRVVKRIANLDPRVVLLSNPSNEGAASARNRAIRHASGRFLAFCDADDYWVPGKLEKQVAFMQSSNIGFSFTAYQVVDAHGRPTGLTIDKNNRQSVGYEDMLRKRATIGCSTVVLDRAIVGEVEMPPLRTGQDYATWLGLLRKGHRAYGMDEIFTHYRLTPGSISRNKLKKALRQWEIYREVEGLGIFESAVCFFHYALRAVFRR